MATKQTATILPKPVTWLHAGAPAIVWRGAKVDGLALPYTEAQYARYLARTGQQVTGCKELKRASGF